MTNGRSCRLKLVGIHAPEVRLKDHPFQMSGGRQQRVTIGLALASEPKLLVADEPTNALHVIIQPRILDLLRDLKQRLGMAILLIMHNLGIVGDPADRVVVMHAGLIVKLNFRMRHALSGFAAAGLPGRPCLAKLRA